MGLRPVSRNVVSDGLGIGLSAALVIGLTFGFYHTASPYFRVVSWWLAARGEAPVRLRSFLDDAYQKTVLRQVGAAYEFRHVILRDRLASRLRQERRRPTSRPAGSSKRPAAGSAQTLARPRAAAPPPEPTT